MESVTLELLRHGPPHGQLLSPLTEYMALCGAHSTVTVRVPFEHFQMLARLDALAYREGTKARTRGLRDTGSEITELLAKIPGLIAEITDAVGRGDGWVHLRLILSATELALLPFELADAPAGCPGAGQTLVLQNGARVCITREVRRVTGEAIKWPLKPKILFAAAAPQAVSPIPLQAHLLSLRRAIEPWVFHFDENDDDDRRKKIDEHFAFLPNASVKSLAKKCSSGEFTHVHLLAHGLQFEKVDELVPGIALHDSHDSTRMDVVDGERLAAVLRTHVKCSSGELSRPSVVTLATCGAGAVGPIISPGAGVAHELHLKGIPLVIASQFPLSVPGSIHMVRVLYEGMLRGDDPRLLIHDLRRELKSQVPQSHDWASIVAYATLPDDFEAQVSRVRVEQAGRRINAALNHADRAPSDAFQRPTGETSSDTDPDTSAHDLRRVLGECTSRLEVAGKCLEVLLDSAPQHTSLISGRLASAKKRAAEIYYRAQQYPRITDAVKSEYREGSLASLRLARDYYATSFEADRSRSWALVQQLALTAVLDGPEKINADSWNLAQLLSTQDLAHSDLQRQKWAHCNLIELYLLFLMMPSPRPSISPEEARESAIEHTQTAIRLCGAASGEVYATRRQLLRYQEFFSPIGTFTIPPDANKLLAQLLDELPFHEQSS